MSASQQADERVTFRPVGPRVMSAVFVAFGVWWVLDAALGGAVDRAVVTGLWWFAAGAVIAGLFWRPAVVVDDAGVELINVLRDVRVPWAAVEAIETRYTLTVVTEQGRYGSWAAPAPGRPARAGRRLVTGARTAPTAGQSGGWPGGQSAGHPGGPAPVRHHPGTELGPQDWWILGVVVARWRAWQSLNRAATGTSSPDAVRVRWRPLWAVAALGGTLAAEVATLLVL